MRYFSRCVQSAGRETMISRNVILELSELTPRDAVGRALADLGEKYPDLVVVTADVGEATRAKYFGSRFPDRYINVGISEQDLIGVATGLAMTGFKVYAVAFAMFLMRAWEQIRNSVARMGIPVKIIGTHSGFSDAFDGASHQCLEDIALLRILPGMTVIVPADAPEIYKAIIASAELKTPCYIRVGRDYCQNLTHLLDYEFEIGKAVVIEDGTDVAIFTTGATLPIARAACDLLRERDYRPALVHFHTVSPLDVHTIEHYARKTGAIVTVEEHLVRGGFGSAVAEVVSQIYAVPMTMIGAYGFGRSARSPAELYSYFGITSENIALRAEELVRLRKRR